MRTSIVFDIKRFSIHDGPGIRTTVFLKGCPLNCWWCHNPEAQARDRELLVHGTRCIACRACEDACPEGAIHVSADGPTLERERCTVCGACAEVCFAETLEIAGREMSVAEVMAEIERDVAFFDESGGGVTFSGGEPLHQPTFLLGLLEACQERGIHTAVDTCGFAPPEVVERIRHSVDLFLYDLKLMDDARHRAYTGVSNQLILDNLRRLSELGEAVILRLPLVPGVNDADEQIRAIGAFAAGLPGVSQLDVLPYHHMAEEKYERLGRPYDMGDVHPPSDERVAEVVRILQDYGLDVSVGG